MQVAGFCGGIAVAECSVPCAGCCVLGAVFWVLCTGCCVLGVVYWVLGTGYWVQGEDRHGTLRKID